MKPTDQQLARQVLAFRAMGYSYASYLRMSEAGYTIIVGILIILFVCFMITDDPFLKGVSVWGFGVFSGSLLRDLAWFRRIKQQWPFTEKIINWQKVEDLAAGSESANPQERSTK